MKTYIGTKQIKAVPAYRIDGKVYLKDEPIPRAMNIEEGYKVVYEDGYESWSPKDVFEKAYKEVVSVNSPLVDEKVKMILKDYIGIDANYNIFIVWKSKVIQNAKWLMCTSLPDNKYYELTYNGITKDLYIDNYTLTDKHIVQNPFENL